YRVALGKRVGELQRLSCAGEPGPGLVGRAVLEGEMDGLGEAECGDEVGRPAPQLVHRRAAGVDAAERRQGRRDGVEADVAQDLLEEVLPPGERLARRAVAPRLEVDRAPGRDAPLPP